MMTRAWLILADILVILLLLVSLILFYLSPQQTEIDSLSPMDKNVTLIIDYNVNITLDDLIRMGEEAKRKPYREEAYTTEEIVIENKFLSRTLEEGLTEVSGKVGDSVFIRIFKEESLLEVWMRSGTAYAHLKDYTICAYSGALGPKLKEGDRQAPEGFYKVKKHQLNPNSKFHLSFNLGYPNAYDRAHKRTGSFLMVHGNCVSDGCYAMTNTKIEEIYDLVEGALQKGQKYVQVHAYPFRMTEEMMALYSENVWYDFWVNLKEGYDYFEAEKYPAKVKVENRYYTIHESDE
jgi:murein L,D-transpeptidase YafK